MSASTALIWYIAFLSISFTSSSHIVQRHPMLASSHVDVSQRQVQSYKPLATRITKSIESIPSSKDTSS